MVITRSRRLAVAGAFATALAALTVCPTAGAAPGQISNMYPGGTDLYPAQAYQVAPRDAYSWRCQRTSTSPNGGVITDLSADPNAVCPARVSTNNPPNWECIA
jgi:hypothetical protein